MKKIIALMGAVVMTLSMGVIANAAAIQDNGVTVVYDAVASTPTEAVVKVYVKGYTEKQVQAITIPISIDDTIVNVDTLKSEISSRVSTGIAGVNPGYNTKNKLINCSKSDLTNDITWTESEPILTARIPLKAPLTSKVQLSLFQKGFKLTTAEAGAEAAAVYAGIVADSMLPMTATVAGTTVVEDANSEAATWFKVETTGVSDATPYWYATVDGAAKKVAFTDANVEGTVTVGLVSTGSVSNAKVVWE